MKELNLPFWIGMDYEEMEFELEVLPDRIEGYDSYLYLGKFNNFLNYTTDKIELLFSMDVLAGVIYILITYHIKVMKTSYYNLPAFMLSLI